jgi:hypothetical protein
MASDIESPAEILNHAATYHRFMLGVKWVAIHLATVIVFLVLWFGTDAGFLAGLVGGALVFAAGVIAMRHGLAHSTEEGSLAGLDTQAGPRH